MLEHCIAVELANVSHCYGKTQALQDVSLRLSEGITVGLIGPDGVGKSTLLSLIAGVKVLQLGNINVFGQNIADQHSREWLSHQIAFMPQGLGKNLYPTLSINENIEFHARLFGLSAQQCQQRTERLLKATGLAPFADRQAGKLSGGMKQKLSLCCALVHNPNLLILDEPTTGVDPLSRRQFWELVKELRQETPNMTVIVATAYIDEAEQFEHLLAMDDGKLIANDSVQSVLQQTNSQSLEQAYIKLLPPEKRGAENGLIIPPFQAASDEPPAIEAHNLTKKFGDFISVDHVSFTISKGEIFGFLGSNGCGKSTTMKMLTGLLEPSSGTAKLLGHPIDASDIETRKKVGYMSQSFSLYEELTVRQNLELHAKLYQIDKSQWQQYVERAMVQFHLTQLADTTPASLSLGVRQRLQLAAACLHQPEVLILDEPTSGVDPAARDMFWEYLIELSRENAITIFITTHFMNEAARCDRISLMDKGKVLDVGTPEELRQRKNADTLEQAFISYLEGQLNQTNRLAEKSIYPNNLPNTHTQATHQPQTGLVAWLLLVWAFALREGRELLRDKIRLFFAIGGPAILLLTMASSISFDINPQKFSVLDHDQSLESQQLIEAFQGSKYFVQVADIHDVNDIEPTLQNATAKLVIEIPAGFGKKLLSGQQPEIGLFIDGAFPSTSENLNTSANGVIQQYMLEQSQNYFQAASNAQDLIVTRFVYNQDFKSIFALTPGIIMLAMLMIPSIMTAVGVVREKEIGSIMNLYGSPASSLQFLLGKQLPYIAIAFISYLVLVGIAMTVFSVPIKGSVVAMFFGAFLVTITATGFGLLVSCFVKSQIAALFATAIIIMIPTMNFSGMMYPTSNLSPNIYIIAHMFPGAWFQIISLGGFTKGLGVSHFFKSYFALILIYLAYLGLASICLKKQEK